MINKSSFYTPKTQGTMITEKLLAVIEYSGLSQTAFAKKVGSTQANLWRQLNGQRVNVATLVAVAQQFPEIDCNWLLRDEGSMLTGATETAQAKRLDNLVDVISMQQETIRNMQDKIKQLQNQ